jgi:L-fuculose-phosphate aldolase
MSTLISEFAVVILFVGVLIFVFSGLISKKVTENIVAPIEDTSLHEIDEQQSPYEELKPFITKIAYQSREIKHQVERVKRQKLRLQTVSESMSEGLIVLDKDGNILEAEEGYRPSSEIKMHLRCYDKREDVFSVIHAHPPGATGFAVAHKAMDMYNMIEDVAVIGSVPLTPYGTPSTSEVPDSIEPYLEEHDVMLLENHGALAVGSDVITAFYRMESLELWAKITINAVILGGSHDISRDNIQKLIDLRGYYRVTGRHPGYKVFNPDDEILHKKD